MKNEALTQEEITAAKDNGITLKQFWAVVNEYGELPMAVFEYEEWAEKWRDKMSATSLIEPYALQIKN